tara:strand:+ start:381 stop:2348 length:1968 start_codon:yes stop_codon:yes gene_type:complete
MGVPTTGSLSNAPTTTPGPGVLPQGIYLSGDIRQSMDSDSSYYDVDPTRGNSGGEIPLQYQPETHLGKLAGYNNTPTERGKITFGVNKLQSRSSQTQEVKMSDFSNFTTTNFVSASESGFDTFENVKQTPSSSIFDFVTNPNIWRASNSYSSIGTLFNLAYIDENNDPRLGILFRSSSYGNISDGASLITQTGSSFDWVAYEEFFTSSGALDTAATIICTDAGNYSTPSGGNGEDMYRMGCVYWQNGTSNPKMVPFSISQSQDGGDTSLTIHSSGETNPTTLFGAQIQKSLSGAGYPELVSFPVIYPEFPASTLLVYNSFQRLRVRRFTISGSLPQNSSTYEIISGSSEYEITSNPGGQTKGYTSIIGDTIFSQIMYGEGYNTAQEGDNVVKITSIYATASNSAIDPTVFKNDPDSRLKTEMFWDTQYWGSSTEKYGSKCLIPLKGRQENPTRNRYFAAVAKSNGYIDVKLLTESASLSQAWLESTSITNSIGETGGFGGQIHHQLPVTAVSLGTYTEYSSSLSLDPNASTGSIVEYVALCYTIDPPYAGSPLSPQTSVIKIYHSDGTMYYAASTEEVVNNTANYDTFNDWNIAALPHYVEESSTIFSLPINYDEYPSNAQNSNVGRNSYFTYPMMFHKNYSSAFRFTKTYISLY